MAIARTGVFVDDYLEYSSSLPADLQRILSTMRELDERSHVLMAQLKEHTRLCLTLPPQYSKKVSAEQEEIADKVRREIETNQETVLSLSTEKVLLAQQAYDLIDSHVKRLDEDLTQFAEDLKQDCKIPPDEPAILPSFASREDKRKARFCTPMAKRIESRPDREREQKEREREREKERDREREKDYELMPPPGTMRKKTVPCPADMDHLPVDPDEPTYCICGQVSFGDMIACDNENCEGGEWFHYQCVGLSSEPRVKGKWYCPSCKALQRRGLLEPFMQ